MILELATLMQYHYVLPGSDFSLLKNNLAEDTHFSIQYEEQSLLQNSIKFHESPKQAAKTYGCYSNLKPKLKKVM